MKKESLKLRELTTFYGAQDWLVQTERGQSYLYRIATDIYNRIKSANNLRLKNYYDKYNKLTDQEERDSLFNSEKIHLEINRVLNDLKESIETLNYSSMIILIDKIVSMSHHGGPLLDYVHESLEDLDYRLDRKVFRNLSGLEYDKYNKDLPKFPLSEVLYSKWGDKFPELAEQSGALPESAEGYNLRERNWVEQEKVDINMKLENLSSILRDVFDIIKKYPEMTSDEYSRLSLTKNWVHNRILQLLEQYSVYPDDLLELISSDLNKYGYLYIAFPDVINRIVNAMLDGDDVALKILRGMQPVYLSKVLRIFNKFIESPRSDIKDISKFLQVFDDLNEMNLYNIGFFVYNHPDFADSFRVRLDSSHWEDVQDIIFSLNDVRDSRESCIRVSDILLRYAKQEV